MKKGFTLLALLMLGAWLGIAQAYTIYPIPQQVQESAGDIELTPEINLIGESGVDEVTIHRAKEVLENAGYTVSESQSPSQSLTNLYLGIHGSGKIADQYASQNDLPLAVFHAGANKFDPYLLQVNNLHPQGDIVVLGDENGSAFYAFATLEQMFEQADGNTLRQITFEDYSHTQYRGIVEGFYGHPYSVENRISLFEFCKRFKLNTFIYGPKADPYHLGNWRDDYPTSLSDHQRYMGMITQDDLRTIAATARENHVTFVWAAHPGLQQGINFSSESGIDDGVDALMTKFQHLYDLGIRGFGVFIDDMNYTPSGNMQAYLANTTQVRLREQFPSTTHEDKISPLFFVPTAYALNYGASYSLYNLASVDQEVVIGFTGYDCFSNVRASSIEDMASRVGRNPLMWWNNPVNDDHDDRIYMRELTAHWTIEQEGPIGTLNSLVLNPMNQAQASKVALFGAADYAWNPATFDAHENWEQAFAYIAQPGDTETAEAIKRFARFSNTLIEDEKMVTLYADFQSKYTDGNLPAAEAEQLRDELTQLKEACTYIETLKDSPVKDYQLMYNDIRCWNAKVKALSTLAVDALDVIEYGDNLTRAEGWEKYLRLQQLYAGIEKDSAYLVSALEGYGTTTYEKFYKVAPGDTYLKPFVEYLVGKAGTNIPGEWPAADMPQLITNCKEESQAELEIGTENIELANLNGLVLAPDEYVGVYIGSLESISIESVELPQGIDLEISVSGKVWEIAQLPIEETSAAYFRLRNNSEGAITLDINGVSISYIRSISSSEVTVSTNMTHYLDYSIEKVIDNNTSTFFWKNRAQAPGDYILLSYTTAFPQHEIKITFGQNDQLEGSAAIEISIDNGVWHTVAEFSDSDLGSDNSFTCNANGESARYVRFIIRSTGTNKWMQVAEFHSQTAAGSAAATIDHNGSKITTLNDRNLTTGYHSSGEGYLEHSFIENIHIENIEIFHNSTFNHTYESPTLSVFNGTEWVEKGFLDTPCTVIDTQDEEMVTALKIAWNSHNTPNIYEILPCGSPYKEEPDEPIVAIDKVNERGIQVYTQENLLVITAEKRMKEVIVYDMTGRVSAHITPDNTTVTLPLKDNLPAILAVQIIDETGARFTQKIIR